jgi:quercetin dioxygenase-like cupin family protein
VIAPGEGETITDIERRNVVLLAERDQLTVTRSRYSPGERGPDPHVHREHTDAFYVLDGALAFAIGPDAEPVSAPAGTLVAVPPNVVHSFDNRGTSDAHFLNFHAPDGGFAQYMRDRRDGAEASFDSFDPPADGGLPAADVVVSGPGEGEPMSNPNRATLMKCVFEHMCLSEWELTDPYPGPPEHAHESQVDAFYVLDGELEVTVEGAVRTVGPQTLISVPPQVRHTFEHPGDAPTQLLNIHAPDGGFAAFLRGESVAG